MSIRKFLRTLVSIPIYLYFVIAQAAATNPASHVQAVTQVTETELSPGEKEIVSVFKRISPFVVNVHNVQALSNDFDIQQIKRSAGSGFIWDKEGYVITNYHVVRGANKIIVTLQGQNFDATMVGAELSKDIAVLKINDKQLASLLPFSQIPLADSSKLQVGQTAIAIGNPFGLNHTLTKGVISALDRKVPGLNNVVMRGMIQTDASINPGNSGGPLLDSHGNLIGMNTLIVSMSGTSTGLGFAVPSNVIDLIVKKIIRLAIVLENGLGIQPLSDKVAAQLKISGVIVGKLYPNSPAQKAGLHGVTRNDQGQIVLGDVITAIDDKAVTNVLELFNALQNKRMGETVIITFLRGTNTNQIKIEWPKIAE